jgi:hypothetical protein
MTRQAEEKPKPSARDTAVKAIAEAVTAIHRAYWAACDAEGRAIDPGDLGAPEGILDAAYDAALQVEDIAGVRGISWHEAREFV